MKGADGENLLVYRVFQMTSGLMNLKVLEKLATIIMLEMASMETDLMQRQEIFMEQKQWLNKATKMLMI